jgi:molybdate transport system regulatory protein
MTRLTIRIDLEGATAIGPGKIRLLEEIEKTGSIRKAAAAMDMSYRRGWLLLRALDETFGEPVISTATGGSAGGGASLTKLGRFVVTSYRRLERKLERAGAKELAALEKRRKTNDSGPVRRTVRRG